MAFESKSVVVNQTRARHRNEEVREVIGDNYQGTLTTDRGRSYDPKELQEVKQQKWLSHILRPIDAVLETQRGRSRQFVNLRRAGGIMSAGAPKVHRRFYAARHSGGESECAFFAFLKPGCRKHTIDQPIQC